MLIWRLKKYFQNINYLAKFYLLETLPKLAIEKTRLGLSIVDQSTS
jgi:hypothetical protein